MKIKFFKPYITNNEIKYIKDILKNNLIISGDGIYTRKVHEYFKKTYKVKKVLLTTSGTAALEMAVRLLNLNPGDEVIVPSFAFSSCANAILNNGAKVNFAEIEKHTLNIDPEDIKRRISKRTRAIMVIHYGGISADMDEVMNIAKRHKLKVIEDAAQAIGAKYKGRYLGTFGDFGCLSFHETKNIVCGEGGALLINTSKKNVHESAEIIREKGTNRSKFFRGEINKYSWVNTGSSYLPSDILAAVLWAQLEKLDLINGLRVKIYNRYLEKLSPLTKQGIFTLPEVPSYSKHNAHIFYIICKNSATRNFMLTYLRNSGVLATFHYIPLHSSPYGKKLGFKKNDFPITEEVSACLIRLPLYAGMKNKEVDYVANALAAGLDKLEKGYMK